MNVFGIFAKRPQPGAVKTRLAESIGDEAAAELYAAFLNDLIDRFRAVADRRVLAFAPQTASAADCFRSLCRDDYELWPQPQADLGVRMAAFFDHAFHSGAARAVLVGSDSPTLPEDCLAQAFLSLERRDCVLGPAADGGYYLVGLNRPRPDLFDGVDWGGPLVLEQTVQRLQRAKLSLHLLPVWYDVDSAGDLHFLRGHLAALCAAGKPEIALNTAAVLNRYTAGQSSSL